MATVLSHNCWKRQTATFALMALNAATFNIIYYYNYTEVNVIKEVSRILPKAPSTESVHVE